MASESSLVIKEYLVVFFYWTLLIVDGIVEAGLVAKKKLDQLGKGDPVFLIDQSCWVPHWFLCAVCFGGSDVGVGLGWIDAKPAVQR